ncbi:nitrate/nitrite two-component system sensor histidine kinase NarQ [Vibrio algicola]|uniref:nitrate/nitrite two-component system sensor histidine kinase NarQ n=1 Tax=Vibrio algicola TaxID=2662262 RepID=UPI001CEDE3DE|nr:nitrate/nitrite two-component system sensor histidine kinase NarQ [Vibrio algicola]
MSLNLTQYGEKELTRPIARSIAKGLFYILFLVVLTTSTALLTLSYSLRDAEIVNVAGSLRMQSYRLAYDLTTDSSQLNQHIELFDQSLHSSAMKSLHGFLVPVDIQQQYVFIDQRWIQLKQLLVSPDRDRYLGQVQSLVKEIDHFVYALQEFSEAKLKLLAWVGGICLGLILLITISIVRFVRKKVVKPLAQLVEASQQIKHKNFSIELEMNNETELDVLAASYKNMANELENLYQGLESAVDKKTHQLQQANESLQILYDCSEALSSSRLSISDFQTILDSFDRVPGMVGSQLWIDEKGGGHTKLEAGGNSSTIWNSYPLEINGMHLGQLRWQHQTPDAEKVLMENIGRIFARALFFEHSQKQTEQLILMEERATIARELHDSLAQSLSYLKIQTTLLRRNLDQDFCQQRFVLSTEIVQEVDVVLSQAYTQLRELLSTFRLNIKEADFGEALNEMLVPLEAQSDALLVIDNQLLSIELDAQQQVHLLQFIREAVLNAIKHAQCDEIIVYCGVENGQITVSINDDGVGFDPTQPKPNHYGLSIMQERASRLSAQCEFNSQIGSGCEVKLSMNLESKGNENVSV